MNGFSGASRAYTSRASYANGARQAFHKPRSSLGAAGRWVHLAAALSPLAISEFVEDAASRRKAIALVSVGSALAYETLWTLREQKRREAPQAHPSR
ncbi:MAG TPA: hypothetical protein VMH80_03825 [Bryobacteraceae bacterium]|nr:hypothetical protein [Bryobacteraceae bacterium]